MHIQKNAPQFIGIGGRGTGLSLFSSFLSAHPHISSSLPAVHFFNTDDFTEKGVHHYQSVLGLLGSKTCCGEVCAEYLTAPLVAQRIAETFPDTKLFAVVRHPLERAVIEYKHAKSKNLITKNVTCAQFLTNHPQVQTDGFYHKHLRRYFEFYSPLELYVVVYEDLVRDPLGTIQKLYDFLEVDKNFIPPSLQMFAPPPEEPKHPGKIKRLIRFLIRVCKKIRPAKAPVSPVPPSIQVRDYFSDEELALFNTTFAADAAQLSYLLKRDMVIEWNLDPNSQKIYAE